MHSLIQIIVVRNIIGASITNFKLYSCGIENFLNVNFFFHFITNFELCSCGIENFQNVKSLFFKLLPETGAEVTVLPIKTRGGSGGPARIVAKIYEDMPIDENVPAVPREDVPTKHVPREDVPAKQVPREDLPSKHV